MRFSPKESNNCFLTQILQRKNYNVHLYKSGENQQPFLKSVYFDIWKCMQIFTAYFNLFLLSFRLSFFNAYLSHFPLCINTEATELSSWVSRLHMVSLCMLTVFQTQKDWQAFQTLKMHLSERVYCLLFRCVDHSL